MSRPPVSFASLRTFVGPSLVGLAVWCASGTLATETALAPHARIGLPAPAWIGAAAALLALAAAPWRRWPVTASPAVLTILPWLPLPIPAAALIWTGRLAWFPIACALLAACLAAMWNGRGETPARASAVRVRPLTAAILAGVLTMAAGAMTFVSIGNRLPGGDEPHYLIIAQSLLEDGDLRIENQHANASYAAWWSGPLPPHYIERGRDGEIYSIHAPGVALLVAPLFAVAGLAGAQLTILLFFGLTGAMAWTMGWLVTRSNGAAWFASSAVVLGVTSLVQGVTIFPDGPGAALTATAAVIWIALRQRAVVPLRWWTGASALLAFLPFLHTRFAVIAAALGTLFLIELVRQPRGERGRTLLAFAPLPVLGAIAWFAYFYVLYGTPDPTAPYGPNRESSLTYVPGGMLGLLFDQQFGLLAASPVLVMAAVGWWRARRNGPSSPALPLLPVVLAYLAAVATYWMWWAGVPAPPARFATAVVPLLTVPLAVAWASSGRFLRASALTLFTASLAISVLRLGGGGELTWEPRGGRAEWLDALATTADLARGWPSFFWRVIGGEVSTEWPFAVHVMTSIAVVAGVTAVLTWFARSTRVRSGQIAAGIWVFPLAVTTAASAGWVLNDATGLWPSVSQLRVLRKVAEGDRAWSVGPATMRKVDAAAIPLVVTVPSTTLPTEAVASWAPLEGVPAGRYTMRIMSPRPAGGRLAVRALTASTPATVVDTVLVNQSRHLLAIDLADDASMLQIEAGFEFALPGTEIDLVPVALAR